MCCIHRLNSHSLADCGNRDAMLRRADEALYEAKDAGRNMVVIAGAETFRLYRGAGQ
jgi:predicted signal transduction protein with EAL and GGDEF domain